MVDLRKPCASIDSCRSAAHQSPRMLVARPERPDPTAQASLQYPHRSTQRKQGRTPPRDDVALSTRRAFDQISCRAAPASTSASQRANHVVRLKLGFRIFLPAVHFLVPGNFACWYLSASAQRARTVILGWLGCCDLEPQNWPTGGAVRSSGEAQHICAWSCGRRRNKRGRQIDDRDQSLSRAWWCGSSRPCGS
jgi:hypothetical protein